MIDEYSYEKQTTEIWTWYTQPWTQLLRLESVSQSDLHMTEAVIVWSSNLKNSM